MRLVRVVWLNCLPLGTTAHLLSCQHPGASSHGAGTDAQDQDVHVEQALCPCALLK